MNKYISAIGNIFKPYRNNMLGRWGLDYHENIVKRKVFWANEDHCGGPCSNDLYEKNKHNVDAHLHSVDKNATNTTTNKNSKQKID